MSMERTLAPDAGGGEQVFDVVIVGGSFAGLATAMELRGHRVLVIDQYPIGAHQSSTCGVPLAIARAVGAEGAIYEAHDTIVLHAGGEEIRFATPEPYVTFDYEAFCRAMLAQTDAEVWLARAVGYRDGVVATTAGPAIGRFVVDAAGWRSLRGQSVSPAAPMPVAGRGIETELPVRPDVRPGLHFFFEHRLVRSGYAWIFPCGDRTRIGVGSAVEHPRLRARLAAFVGELGLEVGPTHGGVMPVVRREPVAGEIFVVGDAAGQCLPVTAEGIRAAIVHGLACGQLIAAALRGSISADEARARYRQHVHRTDRFQRRLLTMQTVVDRTPERLLALAARACSPQPLAHRILRTYFTHSGWPAAALPLGSGEPPGRRFPSGR